MKQKTLSKETPLMIMELMASTCPDEVTHAVHCPGTKGEDILPVLHRTDHDGHRWVLYLDYDGITDYLVYDSFTGSMVHEVYNPGCRLVTRCSENFPRCRKIPQREKNKEGKGLYHMVSYLYAEYVGMDRDGNYILYRKLIS